MKDEQLDLFDLTERIYVWSTTPFGEGPHSGRIELQMSDGQGKALLEVVREHSHLQELTRALEECQYIGGY